MTLILVLCNTSTGYSNRIYMFFSPLVIAILANSAYLVAWNETDKYIQVLLIWIFNRNEKITEKLNLSYN